MEEQNTIRKNLAEQLKEYDRELQMLTELVTVYGKQKNHTIQLLEIPSTSPSVEQKRSVIKAFNDSTAIQNSLNQIIMDRMKELHQSVVAGKEFAKNLESDYEPMLD
ncbi:MAG TPA: hypothetical protein VF622_07115 [Segetibacter sp.]|jgi:hypothetical protein